MNVRNVLHTCVLIVILLLITVAKALNPPFIVSAQLKLQLSLMTIRGRVIVNLGDPQNVT